MRTALRTEVWPWLVIAAAQAKDTVGRRGGGSAGYTGWLAEGPEERRKKP